MLNFVGDIENNGGYISFNSEFSHSKNNAENITKTTPKHHQRILKTSPKHP